MSSQNHILDLTDFYTSSSEEENIETDEKDDQITKQRHETTVKKRELTEKKRAMVAELQKFKTRILAIEKEKKSQLYHKNQKSFFSCLEEEEMRIDLERHEEKQRMKEDLNKISLKVEKLKAEKIVKQNNCGFIEKLRLCIEDIESSIMQMKERQRKKYEEIFLNEKLLTDDVNKYNGRFEQWDKVEHKAAKTKKQFNDSNKNLNLPPAVKEFEIFLQLTGGHQGGWDDYDHNLFVKLSKQNKKESEHIEVLLSEILTRSHKEIYEHVQWYREYCDLRQKKREAIREWKAMKQNVRDENILADIERINIVERKKKKHREEIYEKERLERISKLHQWKEEKAKFNENKFQESKENIRIKQLKQAKEEKRKSEVKIKVKQYRCEKEEEQKLIALTTQQRLLKQNTVITDIEKEKIRERNEKIYSAKQKFKLGKIYVEEEKQKRLEKLKSKVSVNVCRDPSRLLRLTEGLKLRKENKERDFSVTCGARLMPKKTVPTWRQGLQL